MKLANLAAVGLWMLTLCIVPTQASDPRDSPGETVLFPFDDYGIPFSKGCCC